VRRGRKVTGLYKPREVAGLPNGGGAKLIVVEALKPAPIVDGRLKGAGRASGATGYLIRGRPVLFGLGK
jgi:hypothetical protein